MRRASYRSNTASAISVTAGRSAGQALQGLSVFLGPGPHGDGELQVGDRARSLPGPRTRERQTEVGIVVHGIDLDRLGELPAGGSHPAGEVQRPAQCLPDRSLLRLEDLRPSEA